MVKETAATWQQRLEQDGTVVIRSHQHTAVWILLGCAVVTVLGLALLASGSVGGIVVGLVLLGAGLFGLYRTALAVRKGEPHLVVTADRLEYGRHTVPWSAVREVVRHTRTMRGDTTTYVWVLHGHHDRLRLPDTLVADMTQLGGWLNDVHTRRSEFS